MTPFENIFEFFRYVSDFKIKNTKILLEIFLTKLFLGIINENFWKFPSKKLFQTLMIKDKTGYYTRSIDAKIALQVSKQLIKYQLSNIYLHCLNIQLTCVS